MKRKLVLTLVVAANFLACQRDFSTSPVRPPMRPLSEQEKAVVSASNDFGLRLFREVVAVRSDDNVFLSPYSIAAALAMTTNGAAGETEQAMLETLGFAGLSSEEMDQAFRDLTVLLLSLDPKVQLEIANAIWYRQGLHVRKAFADLVQKYFAAPVEALDFQDQASVGVVNNWVRQRTHDKIQKVLDRIDPDDVMFLANAIYFKALWTYQFKKDETQDDTFHGPDGQEIPCRMMVQTLDELPYFDGDGFAAVDLPYGDGHFAMTVLLPDQGVPVDSLVRELS
ncbi:MAG: serpin family protein, partial [Calditrichaeota bacterium]|nr:serpin family protein [Calditrichota bacterium]